MILSGVSQMYWITRLSQIHDALLVVIVIALVVAVFTGIGVLVLGSEENCCAFLGDLKKYFVIATAIAVFSGIGLISVPKTSEVLLIYGVGTIIDYIDNNDTVRQLPDKAIQALDKYLDSLNEDNENKKSHN